MKEIKRKILVVDDDIAFCRLLERVLSADYSVLSCTNPIEALEIFKSNTFDLVIVDLYMPEMNGIQFMEAIMNVSRAMDIIFITAYAAVETAVEAMKKGASDYLIKPFQNEELIHVVKGIFEKRKLSEENKWLKEQLEEKNRPEKIIGNSTGIHEVFDLIKRVADTNSTVLITGESGTGKELVARAIHYEGTRRNMRFVPVNCSAIPENLLESELFGHKKGAFSGAVTARSGLFKHADKGTMFLDEIADMPLGLQPKLLRVIQEQTVRSVGEEEESDIDVRFIAATSKDLKKLVADKQFREDLFYRINVIPISIPPLRERTDDIPLLADFFINRFGRNNKVLSDEVMTYFLEYNWPGNVRELENTIERLMILSKGDIITAADLPFEILNRPESDDVSLHDSYIDRKRVILDRFNKSIVLDALQKNSGNVTRAAAALNMERASFQRIMKRCGIKSDEFRE
ncbi:MAG: sigma-54-dependent Fis family transcriptional regulator [Nitrospiraceae bacterium]|nr:MAG: sigma-54-dependent Fis family transcriptional regulator [Nitrospiraceae bacterium]